MFLLLALLIGCGNPQQGAQPSPTSPATITAFPTVNPTMVAYLQDSSATPAAVRALACQTIADEYAFFAVPYDPQKSAQLVTLDLLRLHHIYPSANSGMSDWVQGYYRQLALACAG